ncbi:MAG: hypothetical protein AVDCRST_MAG93-5846 [uncultured Chloroflexia bacterium]|uniref:Uncharacterized protein n=1 Tax=uncultured Chloroflexia bacterium TaxID=1672391 RepID=A0A6J4L5G0_9CHLR|nr:MAG: hypothetical protein AVDCRST_MAG93-5846 [uncultured Chloroflexia bacterium]
MTEKFSYYDFLAYLVPGTVVLWAAIKLAEAVDILQFISTQSTLLNASAFVVIAFLAGHLVQAEAQRWLNAGHWYSVFPNGFPTRSFLVRGQEDEKGNLWSSESRRLAYVSVALRHGFLDEGQVAKLAAAGVEEIEEARRASQEAYRAAFGFLTDEGRAQKAITANQTYGLFRGLTMSSAVVAALFFIILVVGLARSCGEWTERLATWAGFAELILFPLLVMVTFTYAAVSFRLRARNRGKHHAREVFDALLSKPPSNGEDATSHTLSTG